MRPRCGCSRAWRKIFRSGLVPTTWAGTSVRLSTSSGHGNKDFAILLEVDETPGLSIPDEFRLARPIGTRGLVCYLLGIAASIPFMSGSYFTGFLAPHLGGADFSYFIGFAVAGLAYLISERRALVQI